MKMVIIFGADRLARHPLFTSAKNRKKLSALPCVALDCCLALPRLPCPSRLAIRDGQKRRPHMVKFDAAGLYTPHKKIFAKLPSDLRFYTV